MNIEFKDLFITLSRFREDCEVTLTYKGKDIKIIRDNGEVINHTIHGGHLEDLIKKELETN